MCCSRHSRSSFFLRYQSSASSVVTATGCSDTVVFPDILLGTCCSVTLVCASSDFTWFPLRCDSSPAACPRRTRVFGSVFVCALSTHHNIITNVIAAAGPSRILRGSCPRFSRHVARASVLVSACGDAGLCTDADDPPKETEECGVESCCVQRNFLLKLRLGMTEETSPLQYASHSWILGLVSFNCLGHCTIDSFVCRSQSCGPKRVAL